jgi:hypothetical protein
MDEKLKSVIAQGGTLCCQDDIQLGLTACPAASRRIHFPVSGSDLHDQSLPHTSDATAHGHDYPPSAIWLCNRLPCCYPHHATMPHLSWAKPSEFPTYNQTPTNIWCMSRRLTCFQTRVGTSPLTVIQHILEIGE